MQAITADKDDKNSKIAGYLGTGIVHAVIFALLWFITIGMADPPLDGTGGGDGIQVSLGEPDMGGPSDVPVSDPAPQQDPVPPQQQTETPVVVDETETEPEAVVTQPKEIPKKTEPKKAPDKPAVTKPVEKPVEKPREADKRSLFQKRTTTADGSGYGSGEKAGNQGAEDGSPDGDPNGSGNGYGGSGGGNGTGTGRGTGSGSGDGFSYELKGRGMKDPPNVEDKSKETGKVVVAIVVDKSGKVIKAMPNQRGTTNPKLGELARKAALETRFTPNADAPDEQYGSITIVFKFRP